MAISIISSSVILLISIVAMTLTSSYAYHQITDKDIKDMCYKTEDPEQCETFLKDIHGMKKDAKELAQTAVRVGSQRTIQVKNLFLAKDRETHDEKWKKIFHSCVDHYYYAVRNMDAMNHAMHSRASNVSDEHLKKAYEEVQSCQKLFNGDGNEHSDMKQRSHEVEVSLGAARVAVDNLEKQ